MKRTRIIAHDVVRSANLPAQAVVHYADARDGAARRTLCGHWLKHAAIVRSPSMPATCLICVARDAKGWPS